jgi:hypothetical protein
MRLTVLEAVLSRTLLELSRASANFGPALHLSDKLVSSRLQWVVGLRRLPIKEERAAADTRFSRKRRRRKKSKHKLVAKHLEKLDFKVREGIAHNGVIAFSRAAVDSLSQSQ